MEHNTWYYIKKGRLASKKFMNQSTSYYVGYILYTFLSMVGKLLGLTYPVFVLADLKLSENMVLHRNYSFEHVLDDANDLKNIWKVLVFSMIKLLIIVIVVGLTYILSIEFYKLGTSIDLIFAYKYYYMRAALVIVTISMGTLLTIFLVIKLIPGLFIIQHYKTLGLSEAIVDGFHIMNFKVTMKYLGLFLYHLLLIFLLFGITSGLGYLAYVNMHYITFLIITLGLICVTIMFFPKIMLSYRTSFYEFIKDEAHLYFINKTIQGEVSQDKTVTTNDEILSYLFETAPKIETIDDDSKHKDTAS